MNLAVEVVPEEIRWANRVLKARQAMAQARQILRDADDATRRYLGPLLERLTRWRYRNEVKPLTTLFRTVLE